jgi:ABC-type multidrug transport system fused ATPase/permease subunit
MAAAVVAGTFIERGLQVMQNFVLSQWSNHTHDQSAAGAASLPAAATRWYLSIYFALGLVYVGMQFLNTWLLVVGTVAAARRLHEQLLDKVLRLPMSFFDSQPTGRCAS